MPASRLILMGKNDQSYLGEGWYGVERSPEGILFRATARRAVLRLPYPGQRIELGVYVSARPLHAGEPLRFTVNCGETAAHTWELTTNGWTVRKGIVEVPESGEVALEALNPWSPDALYHNGDARLLGLLLASLQFLQKNK
ncbi:MAG: hypothetical protein GC154_14550 [bacterium]|nr:hypothetical protein [bacterium]